MRELCRCQDVSCAEMSVVLSDSLKSFFRKGLLLTRAIGDPGSCRK